MKIDIALHCCNSNPLYLDFWPLVSKVWRLRMGIEPVLIYVDENHDIPIDTTYGRVLKLKPAPGVPMYMQAVWGRFWGATLFPDKVCIVSDIDMFPISRNYFIKNIDHVPDHKYVHLFPPAHRMPKLPKELIRRQYVMHTQNTFPVCYHVAKGSVLSRVLKLNPDWVTSVNDLAAHPFPAHADPRSQWGIDEDYTTGLMNSYPDQSIFECMLRPYQRIDRAYWAYYPYEIRADLYGDCHSVRPLSDPANRAKVNELLSVLL
jgi:hypothetical protein